MHPTDPTPRRVPTSRAREQLSTIITLVQDPREFVVLTRHDKPVAAVVSMRELKRIRLDQDTEDRTRPGERLPYMFLMGLSGKAQTIQEAAEDVRQVQMTRRAERELLEQAGLDVIEGGEVAAEVGAEVVAKKRKWWGWWWRCRP